MNSNLYKTWGIVAGVVIVIAVILVVDSRHTAPPDMSTATSTAPTDTTATSTATGPSVPAVTVSIPFTYSVSTDKKSYTANDPIHIAVTVYNNTDASSTFSFNNGCQGNYTIGDFDFSKHVACIQSLTSFILGPHMKDQVKMTHFPSVYRLAPGTYGLRADIVGYGGATVPITITGEMPVVTTIIISSNPSLAAINITSPNGGSYKIGGNMTVQWSAMNAQAQGLTNLSAQIVSVGSSTNHYAVFAGLNGGSGSYNWPIPSTVIPGSYKVDMSYGTANGTVDVLGTSFTISN